MSRDRFRAFPLDDALLFFQPSTGRSVRVRSPRTLGLQRRAPRVVMFGISNHCNLRCSFCSRDTTRSSDWTVESAAHMLRGLAAAGSLEVAFGGGEPFAFRGFSELLRELQLTTSLALHVTSNGTLLNVEKFDRFRGLLGQVRLSIYDDERWQLAARSLTEAGQLWGANVLVDEARLCVLASLLSKLAALGCHDVSLLSYVGGDPSLQLNTEARNRLAQLVADAPLPCRISVCFGDRLPTPRLFDGMDDTGDCGAGYDFVTLTPDQRLQSCSFQDQSYPARSAAQVLELWRSRREALRAASTRVGCARALPLAAPKTKPAAEVALWRGFSGNNSGECILVGKFESNAEARRFVADLQPGWAPDDDYSAEWQRLFQDEGVALASARDDGEPNGLSPKSLLALGRSVVALSYDADDAFPDLRALAWKRGGYVVAGGIHLHDSPSLLAVIRGRDSADLAQLLRQPSPPFVCNLHLHGDLLLAHLPEATSEEGGGLEPRAHYLELLAAGRPLGAELFLGEWSDAEFLATKQRLGVTLSTLPRLLAVFPGGDGVERAARFAATLVEGDAQATASAVLLEGLNRRKRVAVMALRQGANVSALDSREVVTHGYFWFLDPPRKKGQKAEPRALDVPALGRQLSEAIGATVEANPVSWGVGAQTRVTTANPRHALAAMASAAAALGARLNPWVAEVEPLAYLLRRLIADTRS